MTEADWLVCTHPRVMLGGLDDRGSERKRRLFACASCHKVRHLMSDDGSWNAVLAAERYADGLATAEELDEAAGVANGNMLDADNRIRRRADEAAYQSAVILADELFQLDLAWANAALALEGHALETSSGLRPEDTERMLDSWAEAWGGSGEPMGWTEPDPATEMANILRDIFGNPFRPVAFSPEWGTSSAVAMATQMYESRDFTAMPILADALQDAGCADEQVLSHCRGEGPHVRGCWVVDAVLNKE